MEIFVTLALALALAWPLGRYLAHVLTARESPIDRVFDPIERALYRLARVDPRRGMTWRGYAMAFLASNLVLGVFAWLVFMFQDHLPGNPDGVPGMRWDLALHTSISFLTNTNQQHYSGQAQLSYLSQMIGIVSLQVLTPMMGLGIAAAMLRGLFGGRNADTAKEGEARDLGNYWVDVTRLTLRVFVPLSLVVSLALVSQGVPSTFAGARTAQPIDASAGMAEQTIPVGPVASMVATKQLGTNGGGWYGPNSAVPLENPTPLANAIETISIVVLPFAVVFMVGPFTGRRKLTALVFGVMAALSVVSTAATWWSEQQPNAATASLAAPGPNLEGKEVRFGATASALWTAVTTQTSNGSVNAMHDSVNPLAGTVALVNMLINSIWGGIGCGLVGHLVFLLLSIFIAGLMIGRTPEVFGRKLETGEVRLLSFLIVLQTVTILGFTALALTIPDVAGMSNPGLHGIAQVFYEYTSAYANNGSGFEGLGDATYWWNLSASVVLLLGRYPCLLIPLMVAGRLAAKRRAPETAGTLNIESATFGATMIAVIVLITVLSYLPALVLGTVGEQLMLAAH
ncbi:potassium-transporting ATPase subunit KdpA [Tahibacter soli]|uniref:Potassium-transporting ATPase potassium-binding subunit n=1 Tax=Tahibacter soli TaxID=2983605 RepID=A0A9X3YNL2_9GAMM|nr:potassium-transporting ATPase subunit KdpA [Tahibacter soli]MDC8015607.1 potassium-transporting ATPase subunit KdpA [Tahibacter soli]